MIEQLIVYEASSVQRETYHMAIKDVLTVELGSKPAISTRSSNAQYSKLHVLNTNAMLIASIQTNQGKQKLTNCAVTVLTRP